MKTTLTCSWCHEANDADLSGRKLYCWSCGHRADVPRVTCDCRKCRASQIPEVPARSHRAVA